MSSGDDRAHGRGAGDARSGTGDELRAFAVLALDRLDPVLALLRGERPEQANRLAAHVAELAAALRDALTEGAPAPRDPMARESAAPESAAPESAAPASPPRTRRVQHVPVDRAGAARSTRVVQRVSVERAAGPRVAVAAVGGRPC